MRNPAVDPMVGDIWIDDGIKGWITAVDNDQNSPTENITPITIQGVGDGYDFTDYVNVHELSGRYGQPAIVLPLELAAIIERMLVEYSEQLDADDMTVGADLARDAIAALNQYIPQGDYNIGPQNDS